MSEGKFIARVAGGVAGIDAAEWNVLAGDENPFTSHAFLSALEDSGSVGPGTGWQATPILIEDDAGKHIGAVPAYLKGHSQGEYVFDHAFADAFERAGGSYYPKLQIAVPFTPATGPRLLTPDPANAPRLLQAAEAMCIQHGFSSAHATFIEPAQVPLFEAGDWLMRRDIQFHWHNRGYACFEEFLGALSSRKRKAVRKERRLAQEGIRIANLRGDAITDEHLDAFWIFYQDTGARKWGQPYLTRAAFDLFRERMGDSMLMVLAFDEAGLPIAGALNFVGKEALYGRYWGCTQQRDFLHFELCYYQAIDAAIALGLQRVEAGAQGGHKLARGYEPVETVSAHYIVDPGFRVAVADYLEQERRGVALDRLRLEEHAPFRRNES